MASCRLRSSLLMWLLPPLLIMIAIDVTYTYGEAVHLARRFTDRLLNASARSIAEQVRNESGTIEAVIPPAALEMFASGYSDRVIYLVRLFKGPSPDGRMLAGSPDVPLPPTVPRDQPVYFNSTFRGREVRAVALSQPVVTRDRIVTVLVVVGETLLSHDALIANLWWHVLVEQSVIVVVAVAFAGLGLNRGLAPLTRLTASLKVRPTDALDPLSLDKVQVELQPFVAAINNALDRVRRQIEGQRRFVADAAHQLRTPLALLRTQAAFGVGASSTEDKDIALCAIDGGVGRMVHLTNQLLTLSRAEQGVWKGRFKVIDLVAAVRHALEATADRALHRGLVVNFEVEGENAGDGVALPVYGNAVLLGEVVTNLLDNAVLYAGPGHGVEVRLFTDGGGLVLVVEDDGPGIKAEELPRVFDRFYRVMGTGEEGSGLGLAIVKEIVTLHGGQLTLGPAERHASGLKVEIRLPPVVVGGNLEEVVGELVMPTALMS